MEESEFQNRIAKLQDALLEGKIDRETYEQLKADLQTSLPQSATDSKRQHRPTQSRVTTASARQPARRTKAYPAIQDSSRPSAALETTAAVALPISEWFPAAVSRTLHDRAGWYLVMQISVFSGIVVGFRIFSEIRPAVAGAVVWGAIAATCGIVAALLWNLVANVCADGDCNTNDTRAVFGFQFLTVLLLYAAGIYWIGLGYYFGDVLGTIVGGRFGHITPERSAIVGAVIGAAKAGINFVNREP